MPVATNLGCRFCFWFLYCDTIDAYSKLDFRDFRTIVLLELLIEFQFADRFFNNVDALGLIYLYAAQILKCQVIGKFYQDGDDEGFIKRFILPLVRIYYKKKGEEKKTQKQRGKYRDISRKAI